MHYRWKIREKIFLRGIKRNPPIPRHKDGELVLRTYYQENPFDYALDSNTRFESSPKFPYDRSPKFQAENLICSPEIRSES